MFKKLTKHTIPYLLICSLLSSCVTTGDPQVHAARTQFHNRKTYAEGIAGGALMGAAAGALLGAAIGAGSGKLAQGAIAGAIGGAAVGSVAGGIFADKKVKEREAYAAKEKRLDAMINNAASTKRAAANFNKVLADRLARAKADSATRAGMLSDAHAVMGSLDHEIATQKETLKTASSTGVTSKDKDRLLAEISGLEREQGQLKSNIDRLAAPQPISHLATAQ